MAGRAPGRRSLIADRTKTVGNDSYHDIDPSGDLMLEVGDPAINVRIRASSKALSLASPVFAAMFSPRFAEGNPVALGELRHVTLPDDDPDVMITFCNAVHLRSSKVLAESFESVEKFSVLCDKYDCAEALRPWSTQWLSRWQGSMDGKDEYLKMVYVSYGFNSHEAFWNATANVLRFYNEDRMVNVSSDAEGFAILPDQLLDALNKYRKTFLREIHLGIEASIDPFLKESNARIASHGCPQGSMTFDVRARETAQTFESSNTVTFGGWGAQQSRRPANFSLQPPPPPPSRNFNPFDRNANSDCSSAMKVGLFFLELSRLELWPLSNKVMAASIHNVLEKASQFKGIGEPASGCSCRTCKVIFKELMMTLATDQLSKVKGLCLNCVQAGRLMSDNENCRHKNICKYKEQL